MSLNTSITTSGTTYRSNSAYGNSSLLLGNGGGNGGNDYTSNRANTILDTLGNVTYTSATSYMANSINYL